MKLDNLKLFVKTIDAGSVTQAAKQLDMPKSSLSRHLTVLEDEFKIRLLDRRPRNLAATEAGQLLYDQVAPLMAGLEDVADFMEHWREAPRGNITLLLPLAFFSQDMGQLVVEFMNKFTDISLSVTHYSGVLPSNVHDFDLSLVVHDRPMPASDLIAKTLMSLPQGIYGSPHGCGYQSAIELDEIIDHCTILPLQEHDWHFRRGKESISVPVSARLTMSSESMRVTAALNGAGIVKLPCYIAEKYVRQGALSQIKTPLPLAAQTVSVVYPSRVIPRKTRILLDFIQENIGKLYSPV